jgi:hypothetical protein
MRRTPSIRRPSNAGKIPQSVRDAVTARSGGYCEVAVDANCRRFGGHCHHRLPRAAGGPHTVENLLDTCPNCHAWIHAHSTKSYERGWLVRRGTVDNGRG